MIFYEVSVGDVVFSRNVSILTSEANNLKPPAVELTAKVGERGFGSKVVLQELAELAAILDNS